MFRTRRNPVVPALALGALLALTPLPASAQQDSRLTHELPSEHLGQSRSVTVRLPASYPEQTDFDYPVLYLLDGETNLDHASAVTAFLAETGVMPEIILVAIHAGSTRAQDYLPPASADGAPGGRADVFLDFMESELFPFIEAEYRLHGYFKPIWSFDGTADGTEGGFLDFLDSLDSRFGFPVPYSESGFQREAQSFLQAGRATEAAAVSRRYVQQYPGTPVSFFLLGNALAAGGDREGAVAAIRSAIELYESEPDPALAPLHRAMKRLLANLGGSPGADGGGS